MVPLCFFKSTLRDDDAIIWLTGFRGSTGVFVGQKWHVYRNTDIDILVTGSIVQLFYLGQESVCFLLEIHC